MQKILAVLKTILAKLYIPCGIPANLQMHIIMGFVVAILIGLIAHSAVVGLVVAALAGIGKEVYDHFYVVGDPFNKDALLYTVCGGIVGSMIVYLIV